MAQNCEGEPKINEHNKEEEKEKEKEKEDEYWMLSAMQLASSSVLPMVMKTVVDLQVLEIINSKSGQGGVSADEITAELELISDANTKTASCMLDRMLCLLASHSILTCTTNSTTPTTAKKQQRLYGLSPIAKYFIPNSTGISLGPFMSLCQDKVFTDSWSELNVSVLEGGIPFNRVYGMHAFEYPEKNPIYNELFNKAMINYTTIVITKILESYNGFDQLHELVDVGGGLGVTLELITSRYPHIKGINFDLPHVIQHAPNYPGVKHVTGDMLESVPRGEAIFMKWVLQSYGDDDCLKLLKNCYQALPEKGKVIVVEGILPVVPETNNGAKEKYQLDLILMTQSPGGKERTQDEFFSLATSAGFAGIRFQCFVCNFWVMEFYK